MAVGALQHLAGVHIPGEMEILPVGEVEESFRDILSGKNRPFAAGSTGGVRESWLPAG